MTYLYLYITASLLAGLCFAVFAARLKGSDDMDIGLAFLTALFAWPLYLIFEGLTRIAKVIASQLPERK